MAAKVIVMDATVPSQSLLYRAYFALGGTESRASFSIIAFVLIVGTLAGGLGPANSNDPAPYDRISSVIGYVYFVAWSVSFYPQVILNWQRRSVVGVSFDYVVLNLLGFSCYTAYNCAYLWNPSIRAAYAAANGGNAPSVQPEDAFFAIHAVALTAIVCAQILLYERGGQRVSLPALIALSCFMLAIGVYLACTLAGVAGTSWLNFLLFLSYIKLAITLMKYTPQVYLNWKRRSTVGWTIHNIILDITGGSLSLGQTLMDSAVTHDWSSIQGNPVKFGLGLVSTLYDIIFIVQHYCLYADAARNGEYAALDANGGEFAEERYIKVLSQLSSPEAGAGGVGRHAAFQIDALTSPINTSIGSTSAGRTVQPFTGDNLDEQAPLR